MTTFHEKKRLMTDIKLIFPPSLKDLRLIKKIQRQNLRTGNLKIDKKTGRFLSTETPLSILQQINQEKGIILYKNKKNEEFIAYSLVSSFKTAQQIETQKRFLEVAQQKGLDLNQCLILHQIYVNSKYRGLNMSKLIMQEIKNRFSQRFNYGIGKIGTDNKISKEIFVRRLEGKIVSKYYDPNEKRYLIIFSYPLKKSRSSTVKKHKVSK
mgnify:CR=1 FL=1